MKSKYFQGVSGVQKVTANGCKINVSYGHVMTEDDQELEAIAIQIMDKVDHTIAEFAMVPETFGALIEAIKELYDGPIGDDLDQPL